MKYEFVEYLHQHKQETLAVTTILQTHGSTPRKAGTTMIVHADGSIFGTIGGGRAENEIRLSAVDALQKQKRRCSRQRRHGVRWQYGCTHRNILGITHSFTRKKYQYRIQ